MSTAVAFEVDLDSLTTALAASFRRLPLADAEEAVAEAALEVAELAVREGLEVPAEALVRQRARWRMLSRAERRPDASLDALGEDAEDAPPVELAVVDVDFESHVELGRITQNPVLRRRMEAVDAGYAATLKPLGSFAPNTIHPSETVARAHALMAEGKKPTEVGRVLGVSTWIVERWRRTRRVIDRPGWSREFAVEAVKAWAAEEGRAPLVEDFRRDPRLPCTSTLYHLDLTKTEICRLAGLDVPDPPPLPPKWSLDGLLDAHEEFYEKHGRWPKWSDRKPGNGLPGVKATTRLVGTTSPARILELIEERRRRG